MKRVTWTDERGFMRASLLRDNDDEQHPERGIPDDPPSLESVFENAERDLHNELMLRGLISMRNVDGGALTGALLAVFRNRLIAAYKLKGK